MDFFFWGVGLQGDIQVYKILSGFTGFSGAGTVCARALSESF